MFCNLLLYILLQIILDATLRIAEDSRFYVKLPLKIGSHLPLYLANLPKLKHLLGNNTPRLVAVCAVANNL
jgi:hypothetical protein